MLNFLQIGSGKGIFLEGDIVQSNWFASAAAPQLPGKKEIQGTAEADFRNREWNIAVCSSLPSLMQLVRFQEDMAALPQFVLARVVQIAKLPGIGQVGFDPTQGGMFDFHCSE